MNLNNYRIVIFLTIVGVFVPFYNGVAEYVPTKNFDNLHEIKSSQSGTNQTVSTFLPKLIWWEGNLRLEIVSNQTGQIQCFLREISGNSFITLNKMINISVINQTQVFFLKIYPHLTTFPGVYIFRLNLIGFITYYEEFEVIFGLGFIPFVSIFGASLVSIIYILIKKPKKYEKPQDSSSVVDSSDFLIGKIKCPNCHKTIREGLTFCPECGDRIPEFLRYNPVSGQ